MTSALLEGSATDLMGFFGLVEARELLGTGSLGEIPSKWRQFQW